MKKTTKPNSNPLLKTRTKEWLSLRRRVFRRDKNKCLHCGSGKRLQCHHRYYLPNRKYWDYPLTAFETLCDSCHEAFHVRTPGKQLVVAKEFVAQFMIDEGVVKYDKAKKAKVKPKPKTPNLTKKKKAKEFIPTSLDRKKAGAVKYFNVCVLPLLQSRYNVSTYKKTTKQTVHKVIINSEQVVLVYPKFDFVVLLSPTIQFECTIEEFFSDPEKYLSK